MYLSACVPVSAVYIGPNKHSNAAHIVNIAQARAPTLCRVYTVYVIHLRLSQHIKSLFWALRTFWDTEKSNMSVMYLLPPPLLSSSTIFFFIFFSVDKSSSSLSSPMQI